MSESPRPEPRKGKQRQTPTLRASEVAAWLRDHPDFLEKHPELLSVLTPPSRSMGESVVDMQRFMVERQRREIERLRDMCQELLDVGRANMSTQAAVHDAVLAVLGARTFEHFIEIVTSDLATRLNADVVTICVEGSDTTFPRAVKAGVYVLPTGAVDAILGPSTNVRLSDEVVEASAEVFGPMAPLVRSEAIVRLEIGPSAPSGLLAIGSRESHFFAPQQGTELLSFLARTVEFNIRNWLDLPHKPE